MNDEQNQVTDQTEVQKAPLPWDHLGLSENAINRALACYNLTVTKHGNVKPTFESIEQERFYYFLLGRSGVASWDLSKPFIITSGEYDNQRLSRSPTRHEKTQIARREAERLSKKHKDTPFYIWGAYAAYVNGIPVQFSPALRSIKMDSDKEN